MWKHPLRLCNKTSFIYTLIYSTLFLPVYLFLDCKLTLCRNQKQANSLIGRSEALAQVARDLDGKLPSQNLPIAVEYPPSIECLLVAENDMLPNGT